MASSISHSTSSRSIAESESDAYFTDAESHLSDYDSHSLHLPQSAVSGSGVDKDLQLSPQNTITDNLQTQQALPQQQSIPTQMTSNNADINDNDITESNIRDETIINNDNATIDNNNHRTETGSVPFDTDNILEEHNEEEGQEERPSASAAAAATSATTQRPFNDVESNEVPVEAPPVYKAVDDGVNLAYVQQQPGAVGEPTVQPNGTPKPRGYHREESQCHEYYCEGLFCCSSADCDFTSFETCYITSFTCCFSSCLSLCTGHLQQEITMATTTRR